MEGDRQCHRARFPKRRCAGVGRGPPTKVEAAVARLDVDSGYLAAGI
jgi:hypothetical protein